MITYLVDGDQKASFVKTCAKEYLVENNCINSTNLHEQFEVGHGCEGRLLVGGRRRCVGGGGRGQRLPRGGRFGRRGVGHLAEGLPDACGCKGKKVGLIGTREA